MELLFVTVIGAALALGVRYAVPGRETHGLLLVPAIGAAATAATWVLLVWLGFTFDGGWICEDDVSEVPHAEFTLASVPYFETIEVWNDLTASGEYACSAPRLG